MRNFCHISSAKTLKLCAAALICCLLWGIAPRAESVSVKLRGKIALGVVLSGVAYLTHTLVKRDKRAATDLEVRLGPPDRVLLFERGFERWRVVAYGERCYLFRNDRFIKTAPCVAWRWNSTESEDAVPLRGETVQTFQAPFLSVGTLRTTNVFIAGTIFDRPVSGLPMWLRPSLSPRPGAPLSVSSGPYRWGAARSLGLQLSPSRSW